MSESGRAYKVGPGIMYVGENKIITWSVDVYVVLYNM